MVIKKQKKSKRTKRKKSLLNRSKKMENFIVIAILCVVIGCAVAYIIKEKKKGIKCIGCPNAEMCSTTQKQKCNGINKPDS